MTVPKRLAFERVLGARVATGADETGRPGADGVPPLVERKHRDLEAFADAAEHVLLGHFHLVHLEVAGVAGEDAPLLLEGAARESLEGPLDDERGDAGRIALLLLLEIRPRKDDEVVGDIGERDPHLLAREHVAIAFLHGDGLNAAHVAARGRFRQAIGRNLLALRLRHQVPLLLILASPREQRQAVEAGVHRHDHAERRVDVLELLARQTQADVVHARAAVLDRHRDAEQAELGHLRQNRRIEGVGAVELLDPGRHLAARPVAHGLLEQALFFGQLQINHGKSART